MKTTRSLIEYTKSTLLLAVVLASPSACANERRDDVSAPQPNPISREEYQYDQEFVKNLTQETRDRAAQDQCFHRSRSPENECRQDYIEVSFKQGRFNMEKVTDEPVLMTEQDLDVFLATTRYRNRFKNLYRIEEGRIVEANPRVRLPSVVDETMKKIAERSFVPAHAWTDLLDVVEETYPDFSGAYLNHNSAIQEILMEYNPHTAFVGLNDFGRLESHFDKKVLCGPSGMRQKVEHIEKRSRLFALDLRELLSREHIAFVNMSFGISHKSLSQDIENLCDGRRSFYYSELSEAILENLEDVFSVLHETESVLSVQASPYNSWDDGPYDCKKNYNMRVIAGAYNHPGDGEPRRSSSRVGKCADVYVDFNLDLESRNDHPDTLMASLGMGFGMGRIGRKSSVSTSNATPLVLSHLIYLRHTQEFQNRNLDQNLVEDLKKKLKRNACTYRDRTLCQFRDPLRERALRIYELKYW